MDDLLQNHLNWQVVKSAEYGETHITRFKLRKYAAFFQTTLPIKFVIIFYISLCRLSTKWRRNNFENVLAWVALCSWTFSFSMHDRIHVIHNSQCFRKGRGNQWCSIPRYLISSLALYIQKSEFLLSEYLIHHTIDSVRGDSTNDLTRTKQFKISYWIGQ